VLCCGAQPTVSQLLLQRERQDKSVQVEVCAVAEAACHRLVDAQQLRRVPEQRLVCLHPAEQLLAPHRLQGNIQA
jgi:hypothetical protein